MLRGPWRAALLAACVLLTTAAPAVASERSESASRGGVSATLTYHENNFLPVADTFSIMRSGQTVYSSRVKAGPCGTECNVLSTHRDIHIVDLVTGAEPQIVLDLFSGGAHCCQIEQVFTWTGTQYAMSQHDFGDPGERIVTMGGRKLFETADDRFAYAFTDFAASGLPIEFLQFTADGRFVNVTRDFPALIAKDARQYWTTFLDQARSKWSDTVGVIAAWAADEDELGKRAYVAKVLAQQAQLGHLNSSVGQPGGARFVRELQRFLKKTGYLG